MTAGDWPPPPPAVGIVSNPCNINWIIQNNNNNQQQSPDWLPEAPEELPERLDEKQLAELVTAHELGEHGPVELLVTAQVLPCMTSTCHISLHIDTAISSRPNPRVNMVRSYVFSTPLIFMLRKIIFPSRRTQIFVKTYQTYTYQAR